MKKKKKIYNFINNEKKYVPIIAKEIVETFESEANGDNVEYSYTLDGETRKVTETNSNTYFVFDTAGETCLDDFKKLLFDEDLEEIKEGSVEEKKLMMGLEFYREEQKEIILNNKSVSNKPFKIDSGDTTALTT